jgi:uncharacterized protein (TIGR02145 family)
MIRYIRLLFLTFFGILIVWSCKKEEEQKYKFYPSSPVIDIDGHIYKTVIVEQQIWMAENLKATHFSNGDSIPDVKDSTTWKILNSAACCIYDNDLINVQTYGRLYNWYATADDRKICPLGWHIPSDNEWFNLADFLGGIDHAGGQLKEVGIAHWSNPNMGATNEVGFTALPGGGRDMGGMYKYIKSNGGWWSSTEKDTGSAFLWSMYYSNTSLIHKDFYKKDGFSVRCVKDH